MIDRTGPRLALALAAVLATSALAPQRAYAGAPDDEAKSRKLFKEADGLANDGKWKEACLLFQAAHDLNSTGGTALRTADCYEKIADYDRALTMYQFIVDHRGSDKNQDRVSLAEKRVAALKKQLGKDQPSVVQKPPVEQKPPVAQKPPPPPPPPPPPNRVPAFIAFGVGGAGAIVGAVLGGLALAQSGDIKSFCGEQAFCKPSSPDYTKDRFERDMASMKAKAWGSNIAIGVAVVGVATGTVLYVLGLPKASQVVTSAVGPGGITLHF